MASKRRYVAKGIAEDYWRQVEILDSFWEEAFVSFSQPLDDEFLDPVATGAAILSRYLISPETVHEELQLHPESFGRLRKDAVGKSTFAERLDHAALATCAADFKKAVEASSKLDCLRNSNRFAFDVLQEERAKRRGKQKTRDRWSMPFSKLIKKK